MLLFRLCRAHPPARKTFCLELFGAPSPDFPRFYRSLFALPFFRSLRSAPLPDSVPSPCPSPVPKIIPFAPVLFPFLFSFIVADLKTRYTLRLSPPDLPALRRPPFACLLPLSALLSPVPFPADLPALCRPPFVCPFRLSFLLPFSRLSSCTVQAKKDNISGFLCKKRAGQALCLCPALFRWEKYGRREEKGEFARFFNGVPRNIAQRGKRPRPAAKPRARGVALKLTAKSFVSSKLFA